MERVGIVGLGLIGGSIGLALRESVPTVQVIGVARRQETADEALRRGAAHRAGTDLALLGDVDVVILACPLGATAAVLEEATPHLAEGTRVTDVGSVKGSVVDHAAEVLDFSRNPFLGGHPMAGKEVAGIAHAEAGLFRGRPWVFTPSGGDDTSAFEDFVAAVRGIGALPIVLSPAQHDRYVAMISHVPFLLSAAYLRAIGQDPAWGEAAALASSGFRDISRLGAGDPAMYAAIAGMNRDEVVRAWAGLRDAMDQFEAAIAGRKDGVLLELLTAARATRNGWAADQAGRG